MIPAHTITHAYQRICHAGIPCDLYLTTAFSLAVEPYNRTQVSPTSEHIGRFTHEITEAELAEQVQFLALNTVRKQYKNVIDAIRRGNTCAPQIRAALGMDRNSVDRRLQRLERAGLIKRTHTEPAPQGPHRQHYALTDTAKPKSTALRAAGVEP